MTAQRFENAKLTKTDNLMINRIINREEDSDLKREIVTIIQQNDLTDIHLSRLKQLLKIDRDNTKQANDKRFIDELATRYKNRDSDKRTKQQQFFLQVYALDNPTAEQLALFNEIVTAEKRKVQANRKNKIVRETLVNKPNAKKRETDNHKKYLIGGALLPMYEQNKPIGGNFGNLTARDLIAQLLASGELYKQVNETINDEKVAVKYVPFDGETLQDLFTLHGSTRSPHKRKGATGTNTPTQA